MDVMHAFAQSKQPRRPSEISAGQGAQKQGQFNLSKRRNGRASQRTFFFELESAVARCMTAVFTFSLFFFQLVNKCIFPCCRRGRIFFCSILRNSISAQCLSDREHFGDFFYHFITFVYFCDGIKYRVLYHYWQTRFRLALKRHRCILYVLGLLPWGEKKLLSCCVRQEHFSHISPLRGCNLNRKILKRDAWIRFYFFLLKIWCDVFSAGWTVLCTACSM